MRYFPVWNQIVTSLLNIVAEVNALLKAVVNLHPPEVFEEALQVALVVSRVRDVVVHVSSRLWQVAGFIALCYARSTAMFNQSLATMEQAFLV